ncbi:MAG TPA: hypothetical protein ENF49_00305 [Candidatus Altiarchaeales archaeon]|nr:hypothetical protein [Candidatus Altiarchaeales archaeon]HEX54560.1 hypothetical protein [Candidatus Altiarchaeales archaeon]
MGIVVDERLARTSPCICYQLKDMCDDPERCPDNFLCFSHGIIGALSNYQDRVYCKDYLIRKSPGIEHRIKKFKLWGKIADVCLEEDDFLDCVIREARRLKKYH